MAHAFHRVELGATFGWPSLALWGLDFAGPTLALEQCASCNAIKCTSDEGIVRFVAAGHVSDVEPDCAG